MDGQSRTRFKGSLKVLFAADAPKAVILRRGPQTHFHLIAWDLKTDTFHRGQWMKGAIRLCDLSPDGTRLLYWAAQYHRPRTEGGERLEVTRPAPPRGRRRLPRYMRELEAAPAPEEYLDVPFSTWTAISKPPHFTALAIWPSMGTWTGGGFFGRDGSIHVKEHNLVPITDAGVPDVPVHSVSRTGAIIRSAYAGSIEGSDRHEEIAIALTLAGADRMHWVDLDVRRGATFAYDGRIFRVANWQDASTDDLLKRAECVADFSDLRFEQIAPRPSATRW